MCCQISRKDAVFVARTPSLLSLLGRHTNHHQVDELMQPEGHVRKKLADAVNRFDGRVADKKLEIGTRVTRHPLLNIAVLRLCLAEKFMTV
jgi:hypothetical protein